jgi:hypothetical protein
LLRRHCVLPASIDGVDMVFWFGKALHLTLR